MVSLSIVRPSNGRDYRALNQITVSDCYPIPHVQVFFRQLNGKKLFSKLDLVRAYNQVTMAPEDIVKTALITPFVLFEYPWMPFGLRNTTQTFQRIIDQVYIGLDFFYAYIDDVFIAISNPEEHKHNFRDVFQRQDLC